MLRLLLSRYLSVGAREVTFAYGVHGKPALAEGRHESRLHFNMSHSGDLAFYVVGTDGELGVDVEQVRPVEVLNLAPQVFSAAEIASLRRLPAERQLQRFFVLWTALEAVVKATGAGLTMDTRQIVLESHANAMTAKVTAEGRVSRWSVQPLYLVPGYRAAIASEGHAWRVRYLGSPQTPVSDMDFRHWAASS
jgi:4'-phosphopantetheinyl transferase